MAGLEHGLGSGTGPSESIVSGPAQIRVVENGPVRVAIEVSRETSGSRFVQTISLAAGDAGKRVEFANVIDWNTRESNLKATFPLTASNHVLHTTGTSEPSNVRRLSRRNSKYRHINGSISPTLAANSAQPF